MKIIKEYKTYIPINRRMSANILFFQKQIPKMGGKKNLMGKEIIMKQQ